MSPERIGEPEGEEAEGEADEEGPEGTDPERLARVADQQGDEALVRQALVRREQGGDAIAGPPGRGQDGAEDQGPKQMAA